MTLREDWMRVSANDKIVIPAKAGPHSSTTRNAETWVPAFAGMPALVIGCLTAAFALALPAAAAETPKRGGTLTFMIPADAPPSFDAHREETYATIHSAAPFYSVLIHVDPNDPSVTGPLACDLRTELPQPTDGGNTYTFKLRQAAHV